MFVYLSKKISVPNGIPLTNLSWNRTDDFIGIGGEQGMLKVLRLEKPKDTKDNRIKGLSAPSNLEMNCQLEGHVTNIKLIVWNEKYQKLTSADSSGRIIVWVMYDGMWYEEMINSRSRVTVTAMQWSGDGEKICIAYSDGQVICGSVDGQRLWGKEISTQEISNLTWNTDSSSILFSIGVGNVEVFNSQKGEKVSRVRCLVKDQILALKWFNKKFNFQAISKCRLAIAYKNGKIQLMDSESDSSPKLIETNLDISTLEFSPDGLYIAICGQKSVDTQTKPVVDFYSVTGKYLRTLKVSGVVKALSWNGLRIGMGIESYIFFGNIRSDYLWGYCKESNTLIYAFDSTYDQGSAAKIMFWNTRTGEQQIKNMKNMNNLVADGDHIVVSSHSVNSELILYNSIGAEIDQRKIPFHAKFLAIRRNYAMAASHDKIFVWKLKISQKNQILNSMGGSKNEKIIEIDTDGSNAIVSICISTTHAIVAQRNGLISRYNLPSLELDQKYEFYGGVPVNIKLNSNSTRLSIIDNAALLYILDLDKIVDDERNIKGEQINLERRDCWNVRWAEDNPIEFALSEKTKLTILKDKETEEPVVTSSFVTFMKDHEIECVLLDDIMERPMNPKPNDIFVLESAQLRNIRNIIDKMGIEQAKEEILKEPSPKLWRILGEAALEVLNLELAEECFIHCKDYYSISMINKIKNINNDQIRRANISAYFGRHDEAEDLFRSEDRIDLATDQRKILGDEMKVLTLIKSTHSSGLADDDQLRQAYRNVGLKAFSEKRWADSLLYLSEAGEMNKNINAHFMAGNFQDMNIIADNLLEGSPELIEIGNLFRKLGQSNSASNCFIKAGRADLACETAIELNDWSHAVEIAEKFNIKNVNQKLEEKASKLLQSKMNLQACQLYRKAGNFLKAARLLFDVAASESKKPTPIPLRVKKLYVLSALLVEQHHDQRKAQTGRLDTLGVLEGVLKEEKDDIESSSMVDSAWRGAEAWHFYILTLKQLYSGYTEDAATTSLSLQHYEDILDPEKIYSLQAVSAAAARRFGLCSRAFTRLESLPTLSQDQKEQYTSLAIKIFKKYKPQDTNQYDRMKKDHKVPTCIVSGRPLTDCQFWMCSTCRHCAYENEVHQLIVCPLCHSQIIG